MCISDYKEDNSAYTQQFASMLCPNWTDPHLCGSRRKINILSRWHFESLTFTRYCSCTRRMRWNFVNTIQYVFQEYSGGIVFKISSQKLWTDFKNSSKISYGETECPVFDTLPICSPCFAIPLIINQPLFSMYITLPVKSAFSFIPST